ncbi:MAG: hypothetical protein GF365_04535 [Candidatus Buchananbacteria bacterium]|nr:hypothetical protein [Candidatus Buchananbacteria bacterium]
MTDIKIYRCSVCGYIYRDKKAPCECPFCHNQKSFNQISPDSLNFEFFKDTWQRQVKWMNATKYQDEIKLNPNEETLKGLAESMGKYLKEGQQCYCPCRVLSNNPEADRKIICPCYLYMGEIEIWGRCHCSLYVTPKWAKENKIDSA